MKPSVSVLLPVFNAQLRLENDVAALLELLAELADRFELLIVDDGSTDDTTDVARQLSLLYPQVRTVRHPLRLGLAEVVQTGLDATDGEILIVGDENRGIDPDDLQQLWPLRNQRGLVMARRPAAASQRPLAGKAPGLESRTPAGGRRRPNHPPPRTRSSPAVGPGPNRLEPPRRHGRPGGPKQGAGPAGISAENQPGPEKRLD